jgi:hypothetical protein
MIKLRRGSSTRGPGTSTKSKHSFWRASQLQAVREVSVDQPSRPLRPHQLLSRTLTGLAIKRSPTMSSPCIDTVTRGKPMAEQLAARSRGFIARMWHGLLGTRRSAAAVMRASHKFSLSHSPCLSVWW